MFNGIYVTDQSFNMDTYKALYRWYIKHILYCLYIYVLFILFWLVYMLLVCWWYSSSEQRRIKTNSFLLAMLIWTTYMFGCISIHFVSSDSFISMYMLGVLSTLFVYMFLFYRYVSRCFCFYIYRWLLLICWWYFVAFSNVFILFFIYIWFFLIAIFAAFFVLGHDFSGCVFYFFRLCLDEPHIAKQLPTNSPIRLKYPGDLVFW